MAPIALEESSIGRFGNILYNSGGADLNALIPSDHARLLFLLAVFAIVFVFEAAFPLFRYGAGHTANAVRNLAITAIFLGVNLLVGPISPYATRFVTEAHFLNQISCPLGPEGDQGTDDDLRIGTTDISHRRLC